MSASPQTLKPSIRLRQSLNKSAQPFPPPHVILHPEDANSKILNAIARALLSVDNRAMTVKDLAEMVLHHGYPALNVTAASQTISSYIRTHYIRCDSQQDQPLLLQHKMSGTPSDDHLQQALYSLSGGCEDAPPSDRRVHFRKGTAVWYLSRVTGAPCPFARAGVRLSDYSLASTSSTGSVHHLDTTTTSQYVRCGQKRKRRSTRECVMKQHDPSSSPPPQSCDPDSDSDEDQPPPKVKLTFKLPPLAQVRAENRLNNGALSPLPHDQSPNASSESCLPPYPRPSITIPSCTPSTEFSSSNPVLYSLPDPFQQDETLKFNSHRRSPSLPCSEASPPPDSDNEDDSMSDRSATRQSLYASDSDEDADLDLNDDDEEDADYAEDSEMDVYPDDLSSSDWDDEEDEQEGDSFSTWDSPGPRSPSAPPLSATSVIVKEEPTDVQGLLDRWEDVLDAEPHIKLEPSEFKFRWDSDSYQDAQIYSSSSASASPPHIKQEEDATPFDFSQPFSDPSFTVLRGPVEEPVSPISPATTPHLFSFSTDPELPSDPTITQSLVSLIHGLSFSNDDFVSPVSPCVSPHDTRIQKADGTCGNVVVSTSRPCNPPIHATQLEGITVYQTIFGEQVVTRRIDTDFVNLTSILKPLGLPHPVTNAIPGAVMINRGSSDVRGLWVPLIHAKLFAEMNASGAVLSTFLDRDLAEMFPSSIREHVRQLRAKGIHGQEFGSGFTSGMQARDVVDSCVSVIQAQTPPLPQFQLLSSLPPRTDEMLSTPLSPREEEIFQELCVNLEWEQEAPPDSAKTITIDPITVSRSPSPLSSCPSSPEPVAPARESPPPMANLRRSKRVAATKTSTTPSTNTRSTKTRGHRNVF